MINNNFLPKYEKTDMPYSDKHRVKVRLWQFILVVLQLLDPKLYTKEFRQLRKQQSGRDVILEVNDRLWRLLKLNFISSIRQYVDIFSIRFILSYPKETIDDHHFAKTLLDANAKPQVAASFLTIAGYALV